ncbi:hypothetical protein [Vibrio cholerae]|uniref:hypothetical protein n=1 Tax=Vibrio cholerae TaxID=666 RepID=UPI000E6BEBD6|nr:hypothetical protein [Vibrio cholerae]NOF31525.1 hypothetical protein [Vibrio cholerae]RJK82760.1 hypothetical protein CHN45_17715 [Vibrio cholerae]GIB43480.1 hypothetical protein VCSRO187_0865 [Vibrio cholerae]HDL9485758.1 hypothetical protein [Vibrio cholerae]
MNVNVSGSAANNYANITHAMYQDWLERFYPQQKQLLEQTQNGELLTQQLGRVGANFSSAQQSARLANVNQMARFGIGVDTNSNDDAKLSLAQVTAKNSLRENEQERAMNVLSGGAKGKLSQLKVG